MIAQLLGVSRQTLWSWKRMAMTPPRAMGRPRPDVSSVRACLCAVRRVMRVEDFGIGGERAWRMLEQRYPLRLVRSCVKTWKARDCALARRRFAARRVSLQVDVRDAAWTIDGTQVGRDDQGRKQALELGRELRSLGYLPAEVGGPRCGVDVIAVLEAGRRARGCLPLVVISDNGTENVNAEVAAYLRGHRIVHMRSAPYVPQHNGWAERGVREVKEAMRCSAGVVSMRAELQGLADAAIVRLNETRLRGSRGWQTSAEITAAELPAEVLVDRKVFYAAACSAAEEAMRDRKTGRARRMAERSAILQTMERFFLIRLTRGRTPLAWS